MCDHEGLVRSVWIQLNRHLAAIILDFALGGKPSQVGQGETVGCKGVQHLQVQELGQSVPVVHEPALRKALHVVFTCRLCSVHDGFALAGLPQQIEP